MEKKVLVVDDDPNICELVSIALSTKGYIVKTAQTGEEGIAGVKEFAPDLVLLDMTLPDLNGIEVAKKIKHIDSGKTVPILMMSGSGFVQGDLDGDLFAGTLNKPFSLTELAKAAEKFAANHR